MTKILVLSDTHKNLTLLEEVLSANMDVDKIIHLGDDYEDLDGFSHLTAGKEVIRVPGIFHPKYKDGTLQKQKIIQVDGKKIILVHSREDISEYADIYLFGHTHNWSIENSKQGIYFNPGHLHAETEKGREATYGTIETGEEWILRILNWKHKQRVKIVI